MFQIQASNRKQPMLPMLPMQPDRPERTHDYVHHGTITLSAALEGPPARSRRSNRS
jgi:hypothetical protein